MTPPSSTPCREGNEANLSDILEHLADSIEAENERGIGVSVVLMEDMREARAALRARGATA